MAVVPFDIGYSGHPSLGPLRSLRFLEVFIAEVSSIYIDFCTSGVAEDDSLSLFNFSSINTCSHRCPFCRGSEQSSMVKSWQQQLEYSTPILWEFD